MTSPVLQSIDRSAREWADQFDFTEVGDCVHLAAPEAGDSPEASSGAFFDPEERAHFRFPSALESFVNHQHPSHLVDLDFLPDRHRYMRRFIELCAEHLQHRADELMPHHPICVIPERYNEVVTAVTVRPGNTPDRDELLACLKSDQEEVRYEAVIAVGTYMVRELVEELAELAIHDRSIDVSTAAAESLIELADKLTLPTMRHVWVTQQAQEHLLRAAAFLLATFGDLENLMLGVQNGNPLSGDDWAEVVVHLPRETPTVSLIRQLLPYTAASTDLRWALGDLLAAIKPAGVALAAELLDAPRAEVRQTGCAGLGGPAGIPYREKLEKRLAQDRSSRVRYAAFVSLERQAAAEAFPALVRAVTDSQIFPKSFASGGGGLGRYLRRNPQLDIRSLLAHFQSDDPAVRARVLESLEEIESGEQRLDAYPIVEAALDDPDPRVRADAVYDAFFLNFTRLRERVQQIAWSDPDESVREEAERSLADWPL